MSRPGAPTSGQVCCWFIHPLDENEVTAVPSWVSAATETAEGVFAYTFVLKSPEHSEPEPPELDAANITATPFSKVSLSVSCAITPCWVVISIGPP